MNHLGLFEGIGGFSLAAKRMGWKTIAWCEKNEFCRKVLRKQFPDAIGHGDITKEIFTVYANKIDVLTGGDPCQPSSFSGKGLGIADPRFLWPQMFRAVKEIGPGWIVNENVPGTLSNGILDQKISDLESENYTCWPPLLISSGVTGALHRRDRVWLVAYSNARRSQADGKQLEKRLQQKNNEPKSASPINSFFGEDFRCGQEEKLFTDEPPLVGGNDGIPKELDAIASLGNAIVPEVALQIFQMIDEVQ